MGGGQVLLALLISFGHGGWGNPGQIESTSSPTTDSTSLRTHSPQLVVETVYETVCNETSAKSTLFTSFSNSSEVTSSTTYKSGSLNTSINILTGRRSNTSSTLTAQITPGHGSSSITIIHTIITEQSSVQSIKAQSASNSLISRPSASSNTYPSDGISTEFVRTSISTRLVSPTITRFTGSYSPTLVSPTSTSSLTSFYTSSAGPPSTVSKSPSRYSSQSTLNQHTSPGSPSSLASKESVVPSLSVYTNSSPLIAGTASNTSRNSSSRASKAVLLSASAASAALAASAASASREAARETAKPVDCNDGTWDLTISNYNKFETDANLKVWWNGGTDNETGTSFPAKKAPGTFLTQALAASFEPVGEQFLCTLEQHSCQPADGCANYAVHIPSGTPQVGPAEYFKEVGPASHYGWFAIHSIANIYSFSETFTSGLTSAGIQIASDNLQLTQTFTKPVKQDIQTRSILLGFAFLVSIFFAFVPVVGEAIGAAVTAGVVAGAATVVSTTLGSTAGFIGISLANGASLDTKAATFGAYMGMIFNNTAGAVDQLVSQLMNGLPVNAAPGTADPTIFDMLAGGKWINSSIDTNPNLSIAAMTDVMRDDLISRGINYIWSQSKIWVTFADLHDDANGTICQADRNGWQASKTCADGGVYYLYRFNEDGHLTGHLDYPWGADKMTDKPFGLQPSWVTRSSAASYRAQNNGSGGFAYDQTLPPANLTDALTAVAATGTLDSLRTLPGVWNISVCDMGTHNDWNADFTQKPMVTLNKDGLDFFFPCCCGAGCAQTHDFIASAQMENFDTIVDTCRTQLTLCKAWPPGVEVIDFGKAGKISNKSCVQGDTMPDP